MSLNDILCGGAGVLVVLFTLIQISPLKFDPWTAIGNVFNKDTRKELNSIKKAVSDVTDGIGEYKATECRYRILRFSDECLHGEKHSHEHFNQIMQDITDHERYCHEHPLYKNEVAVMSIQTIRKVYQDCMAKNSFLV